MLSLQYSILIVFIPPIINFPLILVYSVISDLPIIPTPPLLLIYAEVNLNQFVRVLNLIPCRETISDWRHFLFLQLYIRIHILINFVSKWFQPTLNSDWADPYFTYTPFYLKSTKVEGKYFVVEIFLTRFFTMVSDQIFLIFLNLSLK